MDRKIGCVLMAAGNARRFGDNKLYAQVEGKTLLRRAMESIPGQLFSTVAVVTQYPEGEEMAREFGFLCIRNAHPDWGISHTIRLGLEALSGCDAVLFQVSDQPLLRRSSIEALIGLWLQRPDHIAALGHGGVRGNPCLFPARFFPELLSLSEDHGGNMVIRAHEESLILLEVAEEELHDVDTVEALAELRKKS